VIASAASSYALPLPREVRRSALIHLNTNVVEEPSMDVWILPVRPIGVPFWTISRHRINEATFLMFLDRWKMDQIAGIPPAGRAAPSFAGLSET